MKSGSAIQYSQNSVRKIQEAEGEYYGLVFGLSFSFKGFNVDRLSKRFYNFSYDGRDMYYNLQLLKYAFKIGKFTEAKKALLMFPSYYFKYDQSRSYKQHEVGQLYSVWELDDWHNFEKVSVNRDKVINYINNYRLFGKKISDYYHGSYVRKRYRGYEGTLKSVTLSKAYLVEKREETTIENIKVFEEFIKVLNDHGIDITVVITPVFIEALTEKSVAILKQAVKDFSALVKEIADSVNIKLNILDFSHQFPDDPSLFGGDCEHLNAYGAIAFGDIMNDLLFGNKIGWNKNNDTGYCLY